MTEAEAGVKVDFLHHEAKEGIGHYEPILHDAAEFHLMVNFYGQPADRRRPQAAGGFSSRRVRHTAAGHDDRDQIATPVVFTPPLLVYGGHPRSRLDSPAPR